VRYLLAISIGPVQEFIAAARRTRDLWYGSWLLSEISRSVAKAVEDAGGQLVFPADTTQESVANVVVAVLGEGANPRAVADQARQAAQTRWKQEADKARATVHPLIRDDLWADQVDDVLEFYAAWAPLRDDYAEARRRVMRLLAGRKALRDFLPARGRALVPKSSLDGRRESVLKRPSDPCWERQVDEARKLRLRAGEQLDVVGITKRVGAGPRPYPSVSRIAADPWLRWLQKQRAADFQRLRESADALHARHPNVFHYLKGYPRYADFPYEGTVVYVSRHHEWLEEAFGDITERDLEPIHAILDQLPEPQPYLAVLVADGDRMGATISELKTPETNREFSATLGAFATKVKEIVDEHNGVLVYAGGDDVLAFLPLDRCVPCAAELSKAFSAVMGEFARSVGLQTQPTLSVGIAIGHFMEDLELLLEYAREAERQAKHPDRNGLAIQMRKRGGEPISIRYRWDESTDGLLRELVHLFIIQAIPHGLARDLRDLERIYKAWRQSDTLLTALKADALRVLRNKTTPRNREHLKTVQEAIVRVASLCEFERLVASLRVAELIANAQPEYLPNATVGAAP